MKTVVSGTKTLVTPVTNGSTVTVTTTTVTIVPKPEPDASAASVATGNATNLQFQTPNAPVNNPTTTGSTTTKRPISLDLKLVTKKPHLVGQSGLQMDAIVNTPEVEKIILSNNLIQTPKPGVVFPKNLGPVTTEQEEFGKGFEEALINVHKQNTSTIPPAPVATIATTGAGMSGGSFTYTKLETFPVSIKDEPQNPPASPGSVQPIDMETQELIKLERKRQRNRVAASKCRKRKLERISKLEEKVKTLKGENNELASLIKGLKENVAKLKQEVVEHVNSGCSIPICNVNTLITAK